MALTVTVLVIGGPANPINKNKPKLAKNAEKINTNSRLCMVYSLICTDLKTSKYVDKKLLIKYSDIQKWKELKIYI